MGSLMAPRERIRRVLRKHGSLTVRQIAIHSGLTVEQIGPRVYDMRRVGLLARTGKYYAIGRQLLPSGSRNPSEARARVGERNPSAKLSAEQVREIRASTESGPALEKRLGISRAQVCLIRQGRRWSHV